jgi:ribonuclease M5
MISVGEVIVVEGRYDKNKLSQIVDATIIETNGFGVFSDGERLGLIRKMAETRGIIVLTDSDGAGFLIRNHLKGVIDPGKIKHAYIPDIPGKEKRKSSPSKEGKLGVEGMSPEVILSALRRAGATFFEAGDAKAAARLTKADLYDLGLSGSPDSARRRKIVLKALDLPEKLSPNSFLDVLNAVTGREEAIKLISSALNGPQA